MAAAVALHAAAEEPVRLPPCATAYDHELGECREVSVEMSQRIWLWGIARNWTMRERARAEHAPLPRPTTWPVSLDELAVKYEVSRAELESAYAQGEREGWIGAPSCQATRGPLHGCGGCAPPEKLAKPRARYTEEACRLGIQGVEIWSTIIERDGKVRIDRELKTLPGGLADSSRRALSQSLFLPALHCGEPVEVYYNLTISYRLADGCKDGKPID
ncbi:MAG: energy transducer TonB [Myxococcota bacterium]